MEGSWQLGISAFSKHQDQAWEVIKFLNSLDAVVIQAVEFTNNFIRKSMFDDPKFIEKFPDAPLLRDAIEGVFQLTAIPEVGDIYQIMQEEMAKSVNQDKSPAQALKDMQSRIGKILKEAGRS